MQTNAAVANSEIQTKKRNSSSAGSQLKSYLRHPGSGILALLTGVAAVLTFAVLLFLVGYILVKGIPYLTPSLFSLEYNSENVSLMPSLINTFIMTVMTLLIAAPIGIFCSNLSCRICKKRKSAGEGYPYHRRDTFRYSIYCIWTFRYAVFCNCNELGNVSYGRYFYSGDHGSSFDHAYI